MSVTTIPFPSYMGDSVVVDNPPVKMTLTRESTVPPANCCVFIEWDDVLFPTSSLLDGHVPASDVLTKDFTTTLSGLLTELILKCRNDGLFIVSANEPGYFASALRDHLPPDIANVIRRRFQTIFLPKGACEDALKDAVLGVGDPTAHIVLMSRRPAVLGTAEALSKCVPEGYVKCVRFPHGPSRGMLRPQLTSVLANLERIMTLRRHTTFVLCSKKSTAYQRSISADSTASTTDDDTSVQRSSSIA
ncbi:hypothetical protein Pmar_PMAR022094 [Perkinsus marinus ATCC 50983]|uniref:Apicomplexan-conserved protein n=1 Tax=Perkinsus marinus (strain ATCC 50983 / TXsc) TaxID=423536 RepID=C5L6T1_PERM5|nr:hypothetical protein Pmar_PMAR022094 [Perkinsus marinus ATCC 50983]EER07562.1 hypothetical protein Pmar_PMAR022094 [Perkinsus marinus ATCC 50983]|eukprot:XP_002775746.1 hypothetical protein Pmar_PMAR022094 [Perkinsus marinus ATCC 50983]